MEIYFHCIKGEHTKVKMKTHFHCTFCTQKCVSILYIVHTPCPHKYIYVVDFLHNCHAKRNVFLLLNRRFIQNLKWEHIFTNKIYKGNMFLHRKSTMKTYFHFRFCMHPHNGIIPLWVLKIKKKTETHFAYKMQAQWNHGFQNV